MNRKEPFVILYVDDDEANLFITKFVLEKGGYRAVTCNDPLRTLTIIQEQHIDGVLLDHQMPGMTGMECAQAIRSINPDIPIVFTIGVETDIPPGFLGAAIHVKGEGAEKLLARIAAAIAHAKPPPPNAAGMPCSRHE